MLTATNRSNIKISKEIELKKFSEKTSRFVKKFKTIFLYGELGVGKTTFVKYLINNLQKKEKTKITEIPSPTFNLVYEYKNDCLTAGVKYRKTYYSDRDAKPTEDLMLTLTLFPLTTLEQDVQQSFYRDNDLFD